MLLSTLMGCLATTEANADALQTIKGWYERGKVRVSGLFSSQDRLPTLVARLARSQSAIAQKQANLLGYARTTGGSERTQLFVEERLTDLVRAQEENSRLYRDYRQAVQDLSAKQVDLAPQSAQFARIETAQRAIEGAYVKLGESFGPFWEKVRLPPEEEPVAPAATSAPVAPVPAPAATPPRSAPEERPEARTGSAQVMTTDNQMQAAPMAPSDSDQAYRKTLGEIQGILGSESASSQEKQEAYRRFLALKARRPGAASGR
ncbi:MAG: hypothetical protein HY815_02180 [Candidatus Riflebacteria bacterium]|nr:hypothetical protein [Candidatus Riflebacteria bacterium]